MPSKAKDYSYQKLEEKFSLMAFRENMALLRL
jgi:hypothetical protein